MQDNITLKQRMLTDSLLIIKSVFWVENQINQKSLEFEQAIDDDNYEKAELIKDQMGVLIARLRMEERNMDAFMVKYRKLVQDEKQTLLSNIIKKKPLSTRMLP